MSENYKNQLQEILQKLGLPLPIYQHKRSGKPNEPIWCVHVEFQTAPSVVQHVTVSKKGKKINAEQKAAKRAMCFFKRAIEQEIEDAKPPMEQLLAEKQEVAVDKQQFQRIVYVDADHISFVDATFCAFKNTLFCFYHAYGANLPYVNKTCQECPQNTMVREARFAVADIADTMILIDAATTCKKSVIVSKDKLLYNAALLLEHVDYVANKNDLWNWLQN